MYNLKDMNQIQSSGIGLLVGLIITFFALGKWGIRPPNKKSNISPKNTAFGIWTPIFILVIFKSLNSMINENANEKPLSLILLSLSFICSALWVFSQVGEIDMSSQELQLHRQHFWHSFHIILKTDLPI